MIVCQYMITIPHIINVADLQRRYRSLVNKIKKTGEPMIVLSNGTPDVVVMDVKTYNAQAKALKEMGEEYLLKMAKEGVSEYKSGKTKSLKKGQTLMDLLD